MMEYQLRILNKGKLVASFACTSAYDVLVSLVSELTPAEKADLVQNVCSALTHECPREE